MLLAATNKRGPTLSCDALESAPSELCNFFVQVGDAELGLGHFEAAIEDYPKRSTRAWSYTNPTAAYAHVGKLEEAKKTLAEARRLNPAITVESMMEHSSNLPAAIGGLHKARLPEESARSHRART